MLISGMVDLSPGRVLAFAGTLSAYCMMKTGNLFLALVVGLACGLLFGAINGALITAFDIPPFIATLASMQMADGAIMAFTGARTIRTFRHPLTSWDRVHRVHPVPGGDHDPRADHHVHHTGMDPDGEVVICDRRKPGGSTGVGYPCKEIQVLRVCVRRSLYGACRNPADGADEFRQPAAGEGMEMDAITAVIVGGTSMSGGVGNILNTIVGSLIIGIIKNFMNLQNINSSFQDIVLGILICVAVIIDVQVRKANSK